MNAAELREHSGKTFSSLKAGFERGGSAENATVSALIHVFQMLAETAAQLAEINAHLGKSVFRIRNSE